MGLTLYEDMGHKSRERLLQLSDNQKVRGLNDRLTPLKCPSHLRAIKATHHQGSSFETQEPDMTSYKQYDRPGTQRTDHSSHDMAIAQRKRHPGSWNEHVGHREANVHYNSASLPSGSLWPYEENTEKLSRYMWRQHAEIEARASSLDAALRHTLLWLGGLLLPVAGVAVYALANIK
jgi:hypothetical protein